LLAPGFSGSLLALAVAIGYPLPANDTSSPITIPAAHAAVRVLAANQAYTDSTGDAWSPDASTAHVSVSGGKIASHPAAAVTDAEPASTDQALYRGERTGHSFTYTFSKLPAGFYTVTLKFAELTKQAAGARVFDVTCNGFKVLTKLDVSTDVGE